MTCVELPVCVVCQRRKAPIGSSVPREMSSSLCSVDICDGWEDDPRPECRWPGEQTCGPYCDRATRPGKAGEK